MSQESPSPQGYQVRLCHFWGFAPLPPPPLQERWRCACVQDRGGRAWLAAALLRQSNQSWSAESDRWNIQPVTVRLALGGPSAVLFVLSTLSTLYPRKIQWAQMLVFNSPQLLIHADKTQSSIAVDWTAPLEHWRWNNKGFSHPYVQGLQARGLISITQRFSHNVWRLSDNIFYYVFPF